MTTFDVLAVGNALVDVLSYETDDFITRIGVERGAMTMVDAARSDEIYAEMGPATEVSGGSAANTVVGIASLGGRAAFIGRVADDTFGKLYVHDMRNAGVHFESPFAGNGLPTGRCLVMVTPDAQRTMCTYLGTANELDMDYVDEDVIAASEVTFLEGYLWDEPAAKSAIRRIAELAHQAGRKVAFTLSDPFCVERHREEFVDLVAHDVDILFANEHEITMLYEVDTFDDAIPHVRKACQIAALTRGAAGSVILVGDDHHLIEAHPVREVVDTTGAGDLYAAGFLFGLTTGRSLSTAGALGSLAAAEVISHLGPRPLHPLHALAAPLLDG